MATINTEAIWFRIISVILVGLFLALFIANAVFFDRIRNNPFSCTVTKTEADWMFWLNVIWAIIAAIFFVWAIIRLFWRESARDEAVAKAKQYAVTKRDAAARQLQRTDVGFERVPVGASNRQVPVTYVSSGPGSSDYGSFTSRQVPPPAMTKNLNRQIVRTVASPSAGPAVVAAGQGIPVRTRM